MCRPTGKNRKGLKRCALWGQSDEYRNLVTPSLLASIHNTLSVQIMKVSSQCSPISAELVVSPITLMKQSTQTDNRPLLNTKSVTVYHDQYLNVGQRINQRALYL